MSKLVFFKDLRKRSNDLLTKEFPGDKQEKKLEWKGDSPSGVALEVLFNQDEKGNITGTLKPKYKLDDYKAEINGEFNTKQDVKVEVSEQDNVVKGLKTFLSANNKKGETFGTIGTEFKHNNAFLNGTIDIGKNDGPTLAFGAVLGAEGLSVGANATYLASKGALQSVELVGSYRIPSLDGSIFARARPDEKTKKEVQEVGMAFYNDLSSTTAFSTEGIYNLTTKIPELQAGIQYKIASDTTFKAKFNNEGKLGLSYQQQFNKNTKFVLSSSHDLQSLQTGKPATTFGFGIHLSY